MSKYLNMGNVGRKRTAEWNALIMTGSGSLGSVVPSICRVKQVAKALTTAMPGNDNPKPDYVGRYQLG